MEEQPEPAAAAISETVPKRSRDPRQDIDVPRIEAERLVWKTPDDVQMSIIELYQYAEASANSAINWYGNRKNRKARISQTLRFLAIILTTLGGLTPIISSLGLSSTRVSPDGWNFGQFGYLFLGLAAGCVGFDRFFGFSSGWMRYISTKMTLERNLSEFRLDWAMMVAKLADRSPTPDQVQLMIQRLKEFLLSINNQIEQETQTWIAEFKTNLSEIEKTARVQAEATKPGAISVTLTNGMETDEGFTVALDGMDVRVVRGTKYQIGYVPPGPHKIAVRGKIKGEMLDASELVNVLPGEIAAVTVALPVKQAQP